MKVSQFAKTTLIGMMLLSGCIVSDQLTTLTINPDGSADFVVLRSNIRSTEKGDKAENELANYKAKFDAKDDDEFVRIRESGGKLMQATWVRSRAPFSSVLHAQLPNVTALEKFASLKNEDGSPLITTKFHRDGSSRKLTVSITIPPTSIKSNPPATPAAESPKQTLANGISETRIAVANGTITSARGFTVAHDKQSALLNGDEIDKIVRAAQGATELFLEWTVAP